MQRGGLLGRLVGMKKFFCCACAIAMLGGCRVDGAQPPSQATVSPSVTPEAKQPRLWVSASDEAHSVNGYIERSGTGMSIRYELDIEGPAERMIVGYSGDDGLIAQSADLRGKSLRTGYLSMGDPDPDMPMWRRPSGAKLTVFFKDGGELSARLTRRASWAAIPTT